MMKIFLMMILFAAFINGTAHAHTVFPSEGKPLKIYWAVFEAKPGKMSDMAAISAQNVARSTPNEPGTYLLYGAIPISCACLRST